MAKGTRSSVSGGGGSVLYYEIANFQNGIDTRKDLMTAPAGTLRTLQNCHITPGGEIEKRAAFVNWCNANVTGPPMGLVAVNNQCFAVYVNGGGGSSIVPPTSTNVGAIQVTQPAGITLTELVHWDIFEGKVFLVFLGWTGSAYGSYSYYDGSYISQADGRCYMCRTYKEKMYGLNGRNLFFSAVGDPTTWVDPPPVGGVVTHNGSGYISLGSNDSDSENLVAMEVYYDKMAIFSTLGCQLWFLDPDPSLNQYYQTLRDAGTLSHDSVRQYVANDVYFLGAHGIRSLRARDLTTTAAVADVGSPIDPVIQELIATRGYSGNVNDMGSMQTVLSPRTGRIWMSAYDTIFVLSNFASPNISAWSTYIPGFNVVKQGMVFADPFVHLLDTAGNVWRFGSYGDLTYDSCPVEFDTPALSFEKPATYKFYQGFDAICRAQAGSLWNVSMCFDPTQSPQPFDQICAIDSPTTTIGRIPISGRGTHVQVKVTHQAPGPASFGKMMIHYASSDTG
jgi:hypothetical protein